MVLVVQNIAAITVHLLLICKHDIISLSLQRMSPDELAGNKLSQTAGCCFHSGDLENGDTGYYISALQVRHMLSHRVHSVRRTTASGVAAIAITEICCVAALVFRVLRQTP